jgi:hypothetical protein
MLTSIKISAYVVRGAGAGLLEILTAANRA